MDVLEVVESVSEHQSPYLAHSLCLCCPILGSISTCTVNILVLYYLTRQLRAYLCTHF